MPQPLPRGSARQRCLTYTAVSQAPSAASEAHHGGANEAAMEMIQAWQSPTKLRKPAGDVSAQGKNHGLAMQSTGNQTLVM